MPARAPRERQAAILTAAFALASLVALAEWLVKRWDADQNSWLEDLFSIPNIPVAHSLISVSFLVLITLTLIGRKRIGLLVVAACQVLGEATTTASLLGSGVPGPVSWAVHPTYDHAMDIVSLVVGPLMLWWCWHLRAACPARLRAGSWTRGAVALVTGLLVSVGVTWLLLMLSVRGPAPVQWQVMEAALGRSLGDADLLTVTSLLTVPGWIPQVTSALVSMSLLVAAWLFVRSGRLANSWTPEHELTIRRILAGGEPDSLGYFATRRDKASVVDGRGTAALTYRVLCGVSLASADPVGDREHWPEVIDAWKAEARRFGWVPAVLSASEEGARAYAAAGMKPVTMGDEALLDPDRFSLDHPAMTPVRHAVKRARRAGITVAFRRQEEIGPEEIEELRTAADSWRGEEPERGFSMALDRLGDPADFAVLTATARDAQGRLMAVLRFVPWGRSGVSLDLMRRCPDAPNGVIELVVAELMRAATRLGVRKVSLNFVMFRSVYADADRFGAGALNRLSYTLLGSLDRFWQLERLYRSNQKYQPEWKPRYLCCEDRLALPLVAIAAGVAEGFLPRSPFGPRPPSGTLDEAGVAQVRALATLPTASDASRRRRDHERIRLSHAEGLRTRGREPWPLPVEPPSHRLEELEPLPIGAAVRVAGRVQAVRDHGGVVFVVLRDQRTRFQGVLEARDCRAAARAFARLVDRGDLVQLRGTLGKSRTGQPSVMVDRWELLAKSLHPVPFTGLRDPEARARARATELIVHPDQAELLRHRAAVVRRLRDTLTEADFLEVETPMLHAVHGGATARPFRTYSNAYGLDLSLRIAPELYLKRLVVAGMGRVFELGRSFRNEGADATHNPEFTTLEAYQPYADYTDMRLLAERLVRGAAEAVHGAELLRLEGDGELTDVSGSWPVVPVLRAVSGVVGTEVDLEMDFDRALGLARAHDVPTSPAMGIGAVVEALYARLVEPATVRPTFFVDFPRETSPLTRPHRERPGLAERWDLVVGGVEIATAYSELTDPLDQRARLTDQSIRAAAGDLEAMEVDEAFLGDLELGMPPTGGLGLGVDRLVMTVAGTSIRSVLAFPFVRPRRD